MTSFKKSNLQTTSNWDAICKHISSKTQTMTVSEFLDLRPKVPIILLKHDVECDVDKSLAIAAIESKWGLKATYYFQREILYSYSEDVKKIGSLGHEVAYHYDVLDRNYGNMDSALLMFNKDLLEFKRIGFNIRTVCPHGNPIMNRDGWNSNKDFYRNERVRQSYPLIRDVVVESKDLFGEDFIYLTDAGYSWKRVGAVDENDRQQIPDQEISNIFEVLINSETSNDIIILSSHPHRWLNSAFLAWSKRQIFFIVRSIARLFSKINLLNRLMSKFYSIARRF